MHSQEAVQGVVLEEAALSVDEIACACSVTTEWVLRHVQEGSFGRSGSTVTELRFSSRDLGRARRIRALERDFDAVPELAALVADMLEELDALRARLRRAGLQ
jgi:chaperone modulatory protein CbpM